jgi:diguanylate cyclase (GGDEF)-like protein
MSQHARVLQSVRHAEQMTVQLQSFFEQVVLENDLQALVIQSLNLRRERSWREVERVRALGRTARYPFFLVAPDDELNQWFDNGDEVFPADVKPEVPILLSRGDAHSAQDERFLIISDSHFSAVLCAVGVRSNGKWQPGRNQIICSCDPDVVYTALEYVQGRFSAEHPEYSKMLTSAVKKKMPKATSLHLTLSVTTKLASLWQEQTGREIAINRIATAIRQSLEIDDVLQTAVNEIGATLNIESCTLAIEAFTDEEEPLSVSYFRHEIGDDEQTALNSDLLAYKKRLKSNPQPFIRDGAIDAHAKTDDSSWYDKPLVVMPLVFLSQFIGVLFVTADNATRIWQENEILLLQTVADQVAVAVNHARLYVKSQQEALHDGLTGVYNRRYFEIQFDREQNLAQRNTQPLSLLLVDLDHFKSINDRFGHAAGDDVLRGVAKAMSGCLRNFDTLARYGGEEFAVILPQTDSINALKVAERLRRAVENTEIEGAGRVTASFGLATFPFHARNGEQLRLVADQALYAAKRSGRNRVNLPAEIEDDNEDFFELKTHELLQA